MSPRAWPQRIRDVLDAIAEIQDFVAGLSFDQFQEDAKTVKAVIANFAIIGEAVRGIPDEVTTRFPEIPWHLMRGMRNRLIHSYFEIEPKILWDTIQLDLQPLVEPLTQLLEATDWRN